MLKKIARAALAVLAIYVAWLAYSELSFQRYENPGGAAAAAASPSPGGGVTRELQGVYHIHTTFSDGHATVDEIAARAAREHLDFIILTDHGNPNAASLRAAGPRRGVLVLAGSELNVNRGHLVALGFRPPPGDGKLPSKAEDAVAAVRALGGFTVIAHPYSKVRWSWGDWGESSDYSGIEIVNADTMFKDNYRRVLAYAPLLLIGSRLPLVKMLEQPASNIKRWDQRGASAAISGYFSADAHLYYRGIFALLRLHVLLEGPVGGGGKDPGAEEALIWDALRRGHFYNAVEAVADARGFRFEAETAAGKGAGSGPGSARDYRMGDTIAVAGGALRAVRFEARAPFPFRKEVRLLRDGRVIASSPEDILRAPSEGPGVYRVEVYLKERSALGADIPWIVSNPIYLRKE
jgi:PHP domain